MPQALLILVCLVCGLRLLPVLLISKYFFNISQSDSQQKREKLVYQKYCAVNAAGHLAERLVVNCFVYIQLLDARVLSSNLSALRSLELKWIAVLGGL